MHRFPLILLAALLGISWSGVALEFPSAQPIPSATAAKSFHVLDGFEMQLLAAEPLVTDPVAITYDADGRAYVCEMNDYPYTNKTEHKHAQENPTDQAIGKIRLLEDTDGDGAFDKATVFADGLSWPTGSACWKGGIFVTATPDVWYLKDTDGDGVADVRTKVFTGFKKLNVQAVMNNPIWGLDHRIYIAGGSNGGELQRVPGSESVMPMPADFKSLPIKRNDLSFDPSTGDVRLESGGARFGNTFDDWGNRFLCNIRNPCQHVVLPYRYLARNPFLAVPSALNDCAESGDQLPVYRTSPPEPWREFRAKRWVQEGSTLPKSELVGTGVVTSSSGITIYRGDAYPPAYRDFAFVADVAGNLFYRMKLEPDGVTFKASQVDGQKNFCTSDDLWFRPVNFVNAPDGCLHVCDMYREVIEHPWSIPDDIHASLDLLRGRDKGRLWRLATAAFKNRPTPKLSSATTSELVALLDHPNAWHRETAQRLLFERQDNSAIEPLQNLAKNGKTPQGQAGALWALQCLPAIVAPHSKPLSGLGALSGALLNDVLEKSHDTNVVRNALWVALEFFENRGPSEVAVVDLTISRFTRYHKEWAEMLVPFSMNLNLGIAAAEEETLTGAVKLALADSFAKRSILPTLVDPDHASEMLFRVGPSIFPIGPAEDSIELCETLAGAADVLTVAALGEFPLLLSQLIADEYPLFDGPFQSPGSFASAIARGMSSRHLTLEDLELPPKTSAWWSTHLSSRIDEVEKNLDRLTRDDLSLIAITRAPEGIKILSHCIANLEAPDLQLAALEALGSYHVPAVADILIDAWPQLTPALRDKATTLLLSRTERIAKLLDALEAKRITPAQLSIAAKAALGRQKTPALAQRIAKLIGDGTASNRASVIAQYTAALSMTGNAAQGSKIYEAACMVCHRHKDRGNDVGPNLGTIKAWTAEQILTNILDPNREVSQNFALYLVETKDGRSLSGLIASENAGNLTLKRADGGTETVLRGEIKSLNSPGISLMPEGLEAVISPQQMADLMTWLRTD